MTTEHTEKHGKTTKIFSYSVFSVVIFLNSYRSQSEKSYCVIWDYARKNAYTIITKDADFSNRTMVSGPPPKIIHMRIGNMRLRDFKRFIDENWKAIRAASANHKLVNVYVDRIESID